MSRYKNIIKLLALVIILPIVVWSFTISKSYSLWKEVKAKERELKALEHKQIQNSSEALPKQDVNISLVDYIAYNLKMKVVRYDSYELLTTGGDYIITTEEVIIEGSYAALVKCLQKIESKGWNITSQSIDMQPNSGKVTLTVVVRVIKKRGGDNEK